MFDIVILTGETMDYDYFRECNDAQILMKVEHHLFVEEHGYFRHHFALP